MLNQIVLSFRNLGIFFLFTTLLFPPLVQPELSHFIDMVKPDCWKTLFFCVVLFKFPIHLLCFVCNLQSRPINIRLTKLSHEKCYSTLKIVIKSEIVHSAVVCSRWTIQSTPALPHSQGFRRSKGIRGISQTKCFKRKST